MSNPGRVNCGRRSARASRGQSAVEYLVVCAALAFALGLAMASDDSVLRELLDAFRLAYQKISYSLSIPI